ncbi:uncharacterized protein F4807DRAFT_465106 [Annulohypoxylon truncatum]|uniref:uncharacterized protein n=1 Tax=Annulohypoxylon truncatum TaxID=327061 RepID=UPI002007D6C4|nr:uncharacterized protein F4807DRAFT_465106 [Annulohypoxylon truncatum]KAI1205001.1 hypothetical protein F4807DRAFT_465106 [Annulohypoxylon truncatum]
MVNRSTTEVSDLTENGIHTNESEKNYRRIRACIACRNMKIKCVSVPGSKDCEGCLRFSRPCQDPGPPKARVKTSQKFSELEKRIDALTIALDAERRLNQQSLKQVRTEALWSKTPDTDANDAWSSAGRQDQIQRTASNNDGISATLSDDIIDTGLIDMDTASQLYDHWHIYMRPLMPVVQFSAEDDAHTIRVKKPTLFLTIMTIASTLIRPSLVPHLLTRLNNILAQEVFIKGTKSLDLLQSLTLFSQYYIQPPNIKTFALPQHMYSAVTMSHDLGLNTVSKPNGGKDKEISRTLLAIYFGSSCTATLLRRHQPLVFTSSHRAYIEALTRDDDRRDGDQWLCSLVALQEIFDDASKTLHASHSSTNEPFDDFGTQHLLGIFQQRLADWKLSPSGDIDPRLKNHAASITDLYIHQVAIRAYVHQMHAWVKSKETNCSSQPLPPPFFTATHTKALCHCLKVGADVINIYLSLDDATTCSLPNIFLVWNLCAAICLIKLGHFSEGLPQMSDSVDNGLPSPSGLLEAMIQRLTKLSQHGYFPQSRPFIVAIEKLTRWFQQKKIVCLNNNGSCSEAGSGPVHGVLGTQTPPASPPLQARVGDQNHLESLFELESKWSSITLAGTQYIDEQSIDWNSNLQELDHLKDTSTNSTTATDAFGTAEYPSYFNIDFGNLGFGFDDMTDIDNFI